MDVLLSDNDKMMGLIAAIMPSFFHIWCTKLIFIPYAFKWEKVLLYATNKCRHAQ